VSTAAPVSSSSTGMPPPLLDEVVALRRMIVCALAEERTDLHASYAQARRRLVALADDGADRAALAEHFPVERRGDALRDRDVRDRLRQLAGYLEGRAIVLREGVRWAP
jgi:hypothetical protein